MSTCVKTSEMNRDIVLSTTPRSPKLPSYVKRSTVFDDDDSVPVIFLDLDNTLISAIDTRTTPVNVYNDLLTKYRGGYRHIPPYTVFPRKHLDYFLSSLFMSYRVGVWTAASKDYAQHVISEFIIKPDPTRVLETFLWRDHVNVLVDNGWGFKDLSALRPVFGYNEIMDDAYIVDDNNEVYTTQPDRCLHVKAFEATDPDQGGDSLVNALTLLDNTVRYGEKLTSYSHINL